MELTPEQVQAVNILLSSVHVAQRRGAFSLRDAHTIQDAVDCLVPREEQDRQAAEAEARARGEEAGDAVPVMEDVAEASDVDETEDLEEGSLDETEDAEEDSE